MITNDEEFYSLLSRRNSGIVTCKFEAKRNIEDEELKEELFIRMGQNPIGIRGNWKQVSKSHAHHILIYILSKNMTHDIDVETKTLAEAASTYFLEKFQPEAVFVTNGQFESTSEGVKLYSWITITNSGIGTYDTGIVAIDNEKIGILWAADPL